MAEDEDYTAADPRVSESLEESLGVSGIAEGAVVTSGEDRTAGATTATDPSSSVVTAVQGLASLSSFVYAVGQIEPRFPRLAVEKEFAQVLGRADTEDLTDRQALHA